MPKPRFTPFQKRLIGAVLTLAVLSVGLTVGTFLVLGPQDIRQRASTAGVDFTLSHNLAVAPNQIPPNTPFEVSVFMTTHAHQVTATDLQVTYNPSQFTFTGLKPEGAFNAPVSPSPQAPYPPNRYPEIILYPVQSGDPYFINPTVRARPPISPIPTGSGLSGVRVALGVPCDRCYQGPSPSPMAGVTPIPQCQTSPAPHCYPFNNGSAATKIATLYFTSTSNPGTSSIAVSELTQASAIGSDVDVTVDRASLSFTVTSTQTPPTATPTPGSIACGGADISANGTVQGTDNKVSAADYNYLITKWTGSFANCANNNCGGADISANGTVQGTDNKVSAADYNYLITKWTGSFATCQ